MEHASPASPPVPHFAAPELGAKFNPASAIYWLEAVFRILGERRHLMQLDERALRDIGVNRAEAEREWSRPFWDLPKKR